jgi:hypothetical protein
MVIGLEEILEQGAIVNHRHPQVFGRRIATLLPDGDIVGNAVVLDDVWMIDGDVRGSLLEVSNWVAAELHQVGDETVGFDDRGLRVIDEASLVGAPRVGELMPMRLVERFDVEVLHAVEALTELALGMAGVAVRSHESLVLGAELAVELV